MALKGLSKVIGNLNKEIKKIEGASKEGVLAAVTFIEGESIQIAPSDFGLLRNTVFSDVAVEGDMIRGRVGYTAKYATWVHEMPMKLKGEPRANFGRTGNHSSAGPTQMVAFGGGTGTGTYWDKGENKFLEKPIRREQKTILQIIANRAKIKK